MRTYARIVPGLDLDAGQHQAGGLVGNAAADFSRVGLRHWWSQGVEGTGRRRCAPGAARFPLGVETAQRFAARRVALVGEAGHVMPPIGAQGLNLGLRDAATIGELAVAARRRGADVGSTDVTDAYDSRRRADVTSRTLAVDLLNRTLLSDFLPVQSVRGLGLYLLDCIGPLRRTMMREGMAVGTGQPRLMRGEAL